MRIKPNHFSRMVPGILFLTVVLMACPKPALAHAILIKSSPQSNGQVTGPEIAVTLDYNSRVDGTRSMLSLVSPDGKVRTLTIEPQSAPDRLSAKVTGLHQGNYMLRWQALASDGHVTRGEVPFHVR